MSRSQLPKKKHVYRYRSVRVTSLIGLSVHAAKWHPRAANLTNIK